MHQRANHHTNHHDHDSFHHLFGQVCRARRALAAELLAEHDLHGGQARILRTLEGREEVSLSDLAARLEVQPPTVTRMVRRMEGAGLIERHACPRDQRVTLVRATARGAALRARLDAVWATLERRLVAGLDGDERRALAALLVRVRDNLDGPDPDGGPARGPGGGDARDGGTP